MSLVNDMLRDLDQRRNGAGGAASAVSLTPAPEIPRDGPKRPIALYLIVALIIGAGGVAWFWMQQGEGSSTRELNIAPQIVNDTAPVVRPADGQNEVAQTSTEAETVALTPAQDSSSTGPDSPAIETPVNAVASAPPQTSEILQDPISGAATTDPIVVADESDVIPAVEVSDASNTDTPGSELSSPTSAIASTEVDLRAGPAEDVKNAAQMLPEELDLLAVQEALQLIADNKVTDAYKVLEQEIIDNRYAHQSRETYSKLLLNEGNALGAYELNEEGLALSPNHPGFKKIKARLLISQGKIAEAVQLLITRAPEVSADLEYHDLLATAQLASRDFEGALISYTGLVQSDQGQGKWWYGFAASQESLGNSVAARQGYAQAVRYSNLSANLRQRSQERLAALSE